MKNKKWLLLASLILLLLVGGFLFFNRKQGEPQPGGPPRGGQSTTTVETAAISIRRIQELRILTGSAYALTQFTLANKTAGQLRQLRLDLGSVVQRGQEIAQMETEELNLQIQQLKANIEVTRAQLQEQQVNLDIAEQELDRDAILFSKRLIAESELEQSRATLETSRARLHVTRTQIKQQQEAVKLAELRLSEARIVGVWPGQAPMVVTRKFVEAGATLGPNTPLVELSQLGTIRVLVPVTERDLGKIKTGQQVNLRTDSFPDTVFTGQLVRIAPTLSEQTRTAEAEIQVPNPAYRLKPGMFLKAELVLQSRDQAQVVPEAALVKREDLPQGVFMLDQSDPEALQARFVAVQTGIASDQDVEIISPKLTGQVITLGNHLLKDGAKVQLKKPPAPKDAPPKTEKSGKQP